MLPCYDDDVILLKRIFKYTKSINPDECWLWPDNAPHRHFDVPQGGYDEYVAGLNHTSRGVPYRSRRYRSPILQYKNRSCHPLMHFFTNLKTVNQLTNLCGSKNCVNPLHRLPKPKANVLGLHDNYEVTPEEISEELKLDKTFVFKILKKAERY